MNAEHPLILEEGCTRFSNKCRIPSSYDLLKKISGDYVINKKMTYFGMILSLIGS
jgi:hypothetical protein